MSLQLRPYQQSIIDSARDLMRQNVRSMLIVAPTGAGKTALTTEMLKLASDKDVTSWFIVHRRELIKQSMLSFHKADLFHGIVANGFVYDSRPNSHICSIGSLQRRYAKLKKPKLIVWDEAHHVAAGGWDKIYKAFPDSFHIGLTATPQRLDGTGLGKWFDKLILGPNVSWLIENKYLSPYDMFAPSGVNLSGVHTRMGDFVRSELDTIMDKPTITGSAINEYGKRANGKRAIVFGVSIKHSKHIAEQFNANGIKAEHVDGETPRVERDAALKRFAEGKTTVLSNVDLFGEGFDLPAIECGIFLRPTQSLSMWLQMCGRTLRISPGKDKAILLDHVGNCQRHGLPCEEREWSLHSKKTARGKKKEENNSVKVCDKCFAAQLPGGKVCGYCGNVFETQERKVEEVDGELVEIDKEKLRLARRKEQGSANSLNDLVELGKKRGYKRPHLWAKHVFNSRQRKKVRGGA